MKSTRLCLACGNAFLPLPHVPVSDIAPRRRASGPVDGTGSATGPATTATIATTRRAQAKWRADHSSYWREYRAAHPAYRERNRNRNRSMQRSGNARRDSTPIAKMDVIRHPRPLASTCCPTRKMPALQKWTRGPFTSLCCRDRQRRRPDCKEMT
jgi:hypothetical protein